jgi:hypothetical protein
MTSEKGKGQVLKVVLPMEKRWCKVEKAAVLMEKW